MRPEVMILDEPTAGLDPRGRDEILEQIERLNRQHGLTIILVSHSMEDVARYVERLMVMDHGRKVLYDDVPPKEVFSRIAGSWSPGGAGGAAGHICGAGAEGRRLGY